MLSERGLAEVRASITALRRDGLSETIGGRTRNHVRALLADRDELAVEVAALTSDAKLGAAVRRLGECEYPAEPGGPCLVCCYAETVRGSGEELEYSVECLGWAVSSIYYEYDPAGIATWRDTPADALRAAGLMEPADAL